MMMNELFQLFGTIGVKGFTEAQKDIDNFTKKWENAGKKIEKIGKDLTLKVTAPIVGMATGFALAAMELEASEAKYNTVFAGMTDVADDFIRKFQELTPATTAGARNMASGIQDLLVPMGFMRDEATQMTGETMHLIGALTNFNSGTHTAEDVARAFQSALTGETQSLKALGIQVSAETIKQKAFEMGLADANGEVSKAAQAQALLELAYAQSGDALTAYTEENLDTKTKMGLLKSEVIDLSAQFGNILLPIISDLVGWLRKGVEWFGSLDQGTQTTILTVMGLVAAIGPLTWIFGTLVTVGTVLSGAIIGISAALQGATLAAGASKVSLIAYNVVKGIMTATTWLATTAMTAFGAVMAFVTSPIGLVVLAIGALIAIGVLLYKNWDTVVAKATLLWESIKLIFAKIGKAIEEPVEKAKNFVKDMIEKIKNFFNFKWELPKLKMPSVQITGKFNLLPPEVPKFALKWNQYGGILKDATIFGAAGNTLLGGGEAGDEAVLPLTRDVLGGIGEGIFQASNGGGQSMLDKLDAIIDILIELIRIEPKYQVVLESGALVGELTPLINERLGRVTQRTQRGG